MTKAEDQQMIADPRQGTGDMLLSGRKMITVGEYKRLYAQAVVQQKKAVAAQKKQIAASNKRARKR